MTIQKLLETLKGELKLAKERYKELHPKVLDSHDAGYDLGEHDAIKKIIYFIEFEEWPDL